MLDLAIRKAQELPYKKGQSRVYSIITDKRGRIVAQAANDYSRTHPMMHRASRKLGLLKDYCHSEQLAIVRARGRGCKIYVARVGASGQPLPAYPCPVCRELIREAGHIKSIECTL